MKKVFITVLMFIAVLAVKAQTNSTPAQVDVAKVLKFTNDNYDMGKIAFGKPTEFTVSIQNISNYNTFKYNSIIYFLSIILIKK